MIDDSHQASKKPPKNKLSHATESSNSSEMRRNQHDKKHLADFKFKKLEEVLEEHLDGSLNLPEVNEGDWEHVDFLGDVEESLLNMDPDNFVPFQETEETKVKDAERFLKKFKIDIKKGDIGNQNMRKID